MFEYHLRVRCLKFFILCLTKKLFVKNFPMRGNLYMFIISIAYMDLSGPLSYWYTGTSGG